LQRICWAGSEPVAVLLGVLSLREAALVAGVIHRERKLLRAFRRQSAPGNSMAHQKPQKNELAVEGSDRRVLFYFFIVGCAFAILPLINSILHPMANKDYTHWYKFGHYVLAGKPLYVDNMSGEVEYTYPPAAAVLFYAPLAMMNQFGFVMVLALLNALAWSFSVWSAMVLVAGRWDARSIRCSIVPGLAVAPYVWDIQFLGQLNLLLLALTLGSFLALRNSRPLLASGLFGTAVSLKAFPLPAIAYLIVRKKWKAVLGTVVSIGFLVWIFPGVIRGFDRNTAELKQWMQLMVVDQSGESMGARSSIGFSLHNQSLISCSHRLFRHVNASGGPFKPPLYVNIADLPPKAAQVIGYGFCLLLGLVLLMACRFHFGPSRECEGVEVAMVITLVPLCSPLSWTYFFCWLLPAWTAIGFWVNNPQLHPRVRTLVKIGAAAAAVLLVSALSEQFDPTLQACGVTAFGSVVVFLTLALIRFNLPNRPLANGACNIP
jgi:alpha-1,2-mannosyltransferase